MYITLHDESLHSPGFAPAVRANGFTLICCRLLLSHYLDLVYVLASCPFTGPIPHSDGLVLHPPLHGFAHHETYLTPLAISERSDRAVHDGKDKSRLPQDKYEYEKRKKEKLEEVKARLDFGDARKKSTRAQESTYSESRTISPRRQIHSRNPCHNPSVFTRLRRERSRSPRHEYKSKERRESTVFKRLGSRGRSTSAHSDSRQESSRYTENYSESEDSEGGHWKSKLRRKKPSVEDDDLSQPWVCAETNPFTSRIRHFDFPKMRMPSHVKTTTEAKIPKIT
ncbi:hypothetical protein Tco_0000838 [Tanacetum coccineum]